MLPLALIYLKKEQAGLAEYWCLLDPTPADLSESQAGRPVFELNWRAVRLGVPSFSSGTSGRQGPCPASVCMEGEFASANYCQSSFLELVS